MRLLITSMTALLLVTSVAHAQDRRAIKAVSQELGIGTRDMINCFRGSGAQRGADMSEEQRADFVRALYTCVSEKNPDLTQEQFKETMLKMKN